MALFGASMLFILGILYWRSSHRLNGHMDNLISSDLADIVAEYHGDVPLLTQVLNDRIRHNYGKDFIVFLAGAGFQRITGNCPTWPKVKPDANGWIDFELPPLAGAQDTEQRHIRAQTTPLPGGLFLLIGRDMDAVDDVKELYVNAFGWGLVLTLGLGLIGGVTVSLLMIGRIEILNRASREIMLGDFSQRVVVRGTGDDFDELATNLNSMLERIQKLMVTVKGVSDNVAHDLRTPLARLKTRLELVRTTPPPANEYEAWVEGTIANLDSILETFEALLKIAEIEGYRSREKFTAIDLGKIVRDVAELYEPLADEKDQQFELHIEPAPQVLGDRDLLFRALANLLDNAVKYTPAGGRIEIRLGVRDSAIQLVIADNGPGIPEQREPRSSSAFSGWRPVAHSRGMVWV